MEVDMNTFNQETKQKAEDLKSVMESEMQRGGVPFRATPRYLSDERPEGDFFELPRRWVEPRGK
jgi:hypothetical protein